MKILISILFALVLFAPSSANAAAPCLIPAGCTGRALFQNGALLIGGTDPLRISTTTAPTLTGLTITGFSGFLKATAGVISAVSQLAIGTDISGLGTGIATFLGTPSSANLISAITDETGSGLLVFNNTPSFTTPTLGVAAATSINKITITAPATSATLTLAQGSSLITSGAFPLTLTSSATSNATIPAGTNTLYSTLSGSITSAQLATSLTDETGTGLNVMNNGPTFIAPILGTPASGVLTNATGLPLSTGITGILPAANGGAGTVSGILKANGSGLVSAAAAGTDYESPLTFTYPLTRSTNTISLAFGTTTANSWSALQQFNAGATSTAFTVSTGNLWLTGLADGCATFASGKLTSAGVACGTSSGGITSLNGLTTGTQTFATSSTSGGWGFTSSGSTHTLTIPTASATNPLGLLSSTDWSTFNGKESALTFSTGLTRSTNTITVNTSQNIATLSNLTSNGFVKTSGGTGALSIDTSTYLTGNQTITLSGDISGSGATAITTTYNNVVPATKGGAGTISGILKANGSGTVSAASAGTDYQAPITLTTTGTSGAATLIANTLNIPNYANTTYTATYPLVLTGTVFSVAYGTTTPNSWSGLQQFNGGATTTALTVSGLAGGGARCVHVDNLGFLSTAADDCGTNTAAIAAAIAAAITAMLTAAYTFTNKRIQPRTSSTTSTSTLTPDLSTANVYYLTAQAATLTLAAPTGTPVIGETIAIYITTAAAQTLTPNATYIPYGAAFPATTTAGKTTMVIAQYNGTNWATTMTTQV